MATTLFPEGDINSTDAFLEPTHLEQLRQDSANLKNCLLDSVSDLEISYPCLSEKHKFSARTVHFELSWSFHTQQPNRCQSFDTTDLPI